MRVALFTLMLVVPLVSAQNQAAAKQFSVITETSTETSTETRAFVRPFCMFGLQFIVTSIDKRSSNSGGGGVSAFQVYRPGGPVNSSTYPPQPMKCGEYQQ